MKFKTLKDIAKNIKEIFEREGLWDRKWKTINGYRYRQSIFGYDLDEFLINEFRQEAIKLIKDLIAKDAKDFRKRQRILLAGLEGTEYEHLPHVDHHKVGKACDRYEKQRIKFLAKKRILMEFFNITEEDLK